MKTVETLLQEIKAHKLHYSQTVDKLDAERRALRIQLQAICTHPTVNRRDCYSGHNGDEWVDCTCTVCKKWWTE